jgi:DNA repair ATPase RecN
VRQSIGLLSPAPTGSAKRSSLSPPQIAARADQHLGVSKLTREGIAASDVQLIHGEDRVGEIAQMLGDTEGDAARRR